MGWPYYGRVVYLKVTVMSIPLIRIMSSLEYLTLTDDAVSRGYHRNDRRILLPGLAWEMDWIFDPSGIRQTVGKYVMIKSSDATNNIYLSEFYWRDWADKRPPICIVCPNGELWEIDHRSLRGPGWTVTGTETNLTCHPSIVVPGYHGWLRDGVFSDDLEGRGPNGISKLVTQGL